MPKKPVPETYVDLDRGEKIPNPGIGAVVRYQGEFLVVTHEKWIIKCPCIKPDCRGGKRLNLFKIWEP